MRKLLLNLVPAVALLALPALAQEESQTSTTTTNSAGDRDDGSAKIALVR